MKKLATVYTSNVLDEIISGEVSEMNEIGLIDASYWGSRAVLNTVRDYLCTHTNPKHPHADEMTEYIVRAEASGDEDTVSYCADVVTTLMTQDADGKQYLNTAYVNALRNNPSAISDMLENDKVQGAISMMYDGFFDMCLSSETTRPTEFVEVHRDKATNGLCSTFFLADDVDKFLEIAKVQNGDTFTMGRVHNDSLYLQLTVSKADGAEKAYTFIPVKWVRKAVSTESFVNGLISDKEVNNFYRTDLQN